MVEKKLLNKIKSNLVKGDVKKISQLSGKSTSSVYHVLEGIFFSQEIINAAIQIASENKKEKENLAKKIDSI